ncbi:MAG: hypothetical protein K6F96_03925 [Bacteroidales bacterium]|nr:hypothetical protein [Bacteroidales bacterium]
MARQVTTTGLRRIIVFVLVLITSLALLGCGSQERFGQRKAPRNCHSCSRF